MDDEKVLNINNELNNIDWDKIDHLDIDDAYNVMCPKFKLHLMLLPPRKQYKFQTRKFLDRLG